MPASFAADSDDFIRLYRTENGPVAIAGRRACALPDAAWDVLFNRPDLYEYLRRAVDSGPERPWPERLLAPVEGQEVWAAGVTYLRSKAARMAEAQDAGGGDFYDRVYVAERPELFFKATGHRVVGPGQAVRIRRDSTWSVPEPELALAANAAGRIIGYTVGNDMSARDIEGENPLYLPQAKVYDGCCALGPGILVMPDPLTPDTAIRIQILRDGTMVFEGATTLAAMKRTPAELVDFLFRDNSFPAGCFLFTGTGVVPPDAFALRAGDRVRIDIDAIGTLENYVIQDHA